jgi:hypothetical protein
MVLAFGDVCTLLEGVEKLSTRRPRYAPDEEEKRTREHVTMWFEEHRTDLGRFPVAVKRDDVGSVDPFQMILRPQRLPYFLPYSLIGGKIGSMACNHHHSPERSRNY